MNAAGSETGQILFWGFILIAAICLLACGIWLVRRWYTAVEKPSGTFEWSLQHLRDLRAEGQITDAEFETLKAKVLREAGATPTRNNGAE